MQIKVREDNERIIISKRFSNDVVISTWENKDTYWHPSSFKVEISNQVIYIDPIDLFVYEPADIILITHDHSDHFSINEISKLIKENTNIVCAEKCIISIPNIETTNVKPNQTITINGIVISTVPAYNFVHQKVFNYVGYVISNGKTSIYHAGDTGKTIEMEKIGVIDIAFIPISTSFLTMSEKAAAKVINEINPKIAIPMHYETQRGLAQKFKDLVNKSIDVEIMEQ
jgi:L-ascorbate metabolism protein UlaG (beta-lactamase superfamily)